jgi:transcriptional regulator with XRE-family HTH domain
MTSGQYGDSVDLSPAQCKAARALLGWSQSDLAQRAKVATSTVADFERAARTPVTNNLEAVKAAFQANGISFAMGGAIVGPLPTFQTETLVPRHEQRPVRWIDETALNAWAAPISTREEFPDLMRRLLLAKYGYGTHLRFPASGAIQLKGWDAQTNVPSRDALIPSGQAGWEFGVNRGIREKADSDYENRVRAAPATELSSMTFVFATPRYWGAKDDWAAKRRAEGIFRDVRVIDGVDLAQLLEQTPSVSLWLAQKIGRVPEGIRLLRNAWQEWAFSTAIPLSEQLILTGRDECSTQIHRWINDSASAIGLRGESVEEVIAFLYASLSEYPSDIFDAYQSRVVVVDTPQAARDIADVPVPLIVVLAEMDPGVSNLLVSKGHHVFQAYGSGIAASDRVPTLPRIGRNALREQLLAMLPSSHTRLDEDRTKNLARDAGGSLTVLRRLMEPAPGQKPPVWSRTDQARAIIPMLFAGAWNDENDLDRAIVSGLAGVPYPEVQATLTKALTLAESPVRKVGSIWKVASPRDAWLRLSRFMISPDFETYEKSLLTVLATDDASDVEPDWFAPRLPKYSEELKQGLVETAVLIGVFGKLQPNVPNLEERASKIVLALFDNADGKRWRALGPFMKELAEASPDAFLSAVDKSLRSNTQAIMALFEAKNDLWGKRSKHSNLLWALEMLAWSEEYLPMVTAALLQLAKLDPKQDNYSNRPENSLRQIYLPWFPQTNVPLTDRLAILDGMRARFPDEMWKLTLALYPKGHDHVSHGPTPMWRSFDPERPLEVVTNGVVWAAAEATAGWIVEDVGADYQRWEAVLNRLSDFAPEVRSALGEKVVPAGLAMPAMDREKFREKLRFQIHRNREFSHAGWSIPEPELASLERAYFALEPSDPYWKVSWLFRDYSVPMLNPPGTDFREAERLSFEARKEALIQLHGGRDWTVTRKLVEIDPEVKPRLVGAALAEAAEDGWTWQVWTDLLASGDEIGREIAAAAIESLGQKGSVDLTERLIARAEVEHWPDQSVATVMRSLPKDKGLYDWVERSSPNVQGLFWRHVWHHGLDLESRGLPWIITNLIAHERPYSAAELLHRHLKDVDSRIIVAVLESILKTQDSSAAEGNESVMVQYYVEHMFEQLDHEKNLPSDQLATLEWQFLNLLDNSKRPPRMLLSQLSTSPEFFVELLSLMYRAEGEEPVEIEDDDDRARVKNLAHHAYTLFHMWKLLPGQTGERINAEELNRWVDSARTLSSAAGRGDIADVKIGELFAFSPDDPDGTWPHSAVRSVVERIASDRLESGIHVGVHNKRGVTTRGIFDGGDLEREEVAYFRGMAKRVRLTSPRTAALLEKIARSYEHEARHFDDEAARRDW